MRIRKIQDKPSKTKKVVIILIVIFAVLAIIAYLITTNKANNIIPSASENKIDANYIKQNAQQEYGKSVNYNSEKNIGWQIFHSDGNNIYLISNTYIPYESIPNSTKNGTATTNKPEKNPKNDYGVSLEKVLGDYDGSSNITDASPVHKWLNDFYTKGYKNDKFNMKAVAYMLDTNAWSSFANENAEYAIGGPTIEMLFNSYNSKYNTSFEVDVPREIGYQIRKSSEDEWSDKVDLMLNKDDNLYVTNTDDDTLRGYWIASPCNGAISFVMTAYNDGTVAFETYNNNNTLGFRPVVCLKADTVLQDIGNNTYNIK